MLKLEPGQYHSFEKARALAWPRCSRHTPVQAPSDARSDIWPAVDCLVYCLPPPAGYLFQAPRGGGGGDGSLLRLGQARLCTIAAPLMAIMLRHRARLVRMFERRASCASQALMWEVLLGQVRPIVRLLAAAAAAAIAVVRIRAPAAGCSCCCARPARTQCPIGQLQAAFVGGQYCLGHLFDSLARTR